MTRFERVEDFRDRRWALVALLVLLALLGIGIGTITGGPADFDRPGMLVSTPTPTPTPTDTPAPTTGGGGDGGPTAAGGTGAESSATPTQPPTSRPGGGGGQPATPTATGTDTRSGDDAGSGSGGSGGTGASSATGGTSSTSEDGEMATRTAGPADGDDQTHEGVHVETNGSEAILRFEGVLPGDVGQEAVRIRNAGNVTARFGVGDVNVTDHENGLTEPESVVDTPGDGGELSRHVQVVIEVRYPDGDSEALYGTGSGPKSLRNIAASGAAGASRELGPGDNATLRFEWHLPVETGNVVQSDGATFTVDVGLAGTGSDE